MHTKIFDSSSVNKKSMVTIHSRSRRRLSFDPRSFAKERGINEGDSVCRPCRDDVRRCVKNPMYKPRWEKSTQSVKCCILHCNNYSFAMSKLDINEKLAVAIQQCGLSCNSSTIPTPTPLCKEHYHVIYKKA